MSKVRTISATVFLFSQTLFAAPPPAERLEGESISEDGLGLFNSYISDDNAFAPASDGDDDLGEQVILQRETKRAPVRVRADTFLFWSDNVSSTSSDEEEGWFFGGSVSARWKQRLNANLFFDTYAYQDAYFYDRDDLDFQSTEFGIGFVGNIPGLDDLTLYGRYEFLYVHSDNPLSDMPGEGDEVDSRYHRLRLGAYQPLISKPNHTVTISGDGRWDFDASSGTQRRQQLSGRLAYTWSATGRLRLTSFYRLAYRDYLASDREDWNQYLGIEANYTLNSWAQAYGSILYGINESNVSSRDYEAFQAGIGLGLRASF